MDLLEKTKGVMTALTHEFFKKGLTLCFGYFFTKTNSIIRKKLL